MHNFRILGIEVFGERKYSLNYRATKPETETVDRLIETTESDGEADVMRAALQLHEAFMKRMSNGSSFFSEDKGTGERTPYDPFLHQRDKSQPRGKYYRMSYPKAGRDRVQAMIEYTRQKTGDKSKNGEDVLSAALTSYEIYIRHEEENNPLLVRDDRTGEFTPFKPFKEEDPAPNPASRRPPPSEPASHHPA